MQNTVKGDQPCYACPRQPTAEKQPNQGLDLTIPGAAQSVPVGPLCLLSGLAAQAHVGAPAKAGERQQVRMTSRSLQISQVLSRKESIHRGATSCVAWSDPRGEA